MRAIHDSTWLPYRVAIVRRSARVHLSAIPPSMTVVSNGPAVGRQIDKRGTCNVDSTTGSPSENRSSTDGEVDIDEGVHLADLLLMLNPEQVDKVVYDL